LDGIVNVFSRQSGLSVANAPLSTCQVLIITQRELLGRLLLLLVLVWSVEEVWAQTRQHLSAGAIMFLATCQSVAMWRQATVWEEATLSVAPAQVLQHSTALCAASSSARPGALLPAVAIP
jgi:hypothetical protein